MEKSRKPDSCYVWKHTVFPQLHSLMHIPPARRQLLSQLGEILAARRRPSLVGACFQGEAIRSNNKEHSRFTDFSAFLFLLLSMYCKT